MHGEYKVPGGKLVVVDLEAAGGVITEARLAGDFFLEPDEALDAINAALRGIAVETDAAAIADRVRLALPEGTVLFGFSPDAVGIVVRRALTQATDWDDYTWEIVHHAPLPGRLNLALDQVLTEAVGAGRRRPTLRFWEWDMPGVAILGSFQSVKNEVDLEAAERHGIEVVRRISGGGTMFVEPGSVITYSLSVPGELVAGMPFAESYAFLDDWVLHGLRSLGIEAEYKPLNDIASPKGKIGGAAQKRLGSGAILHHATMSYDIDAQKMTDVLRIGREKLSDKGIASAVKRVDPLRSQTGLSREEITEHLKQTFMSLHRTVPGEITPEELAEAEELVVSKFTTPEWIYRVP